MNHMWFYVRHSLNDLRANGQRSVFAILCIAAGAAASVALAIIGQSMLHTLTQGAREANKGDIRLTAPEAGEIPDELLASAVQQGLLSTYQSGFGYVEHSLTENGIEQIRQRIEQAFPSALLEWNTELRPIDPRRMQIKTVSKGTQAYGPTLFLIDRKSYPFYGLVMTDGGLSLKEALESPLTVVLNQKLAEKLRITSGDEVRLSGSNAVFKVSGVVKESNEASAASSQLASQGFIYADQSCATSFERTASISVLNLKLADHAPCADISTALTQQFPSLKLTDREEVAAGNSQLNRSMATAAGVMGLLALLVGGIGIANTMQVVVHRRKTEIAILKTIGLDGMKIVWLFIVQAAGMGLLGGLAGTIIGYGLAYFMQNIVSRFLEAELILVYGWRPAILGVFLGIIVAVIFGLLPALAASTVRPIVVLRAEGAAGSRLGFRRVAMAFLLMAALLTIAGIPVFGSLLASAIAVAAGVLLVLFLIAISRISLWLLVPLAIRLVPVEIRVSLKSMMARQGRAISTSLALTIGILMLGTVLLLASSLIDMVRNTGKSALGGTAAIMFDSQASASEHSRWLAGGNLPGHRGHFVNRFYQADAKFVETSGGRFTLDEFRRLREADVGSGTLSRLGEAISGRMGAVELTERMTSIPVYEEGRPFRAEDQDQRVVILESSPEVELAGIGPGDKITYAFGGLFGEEVTFEVIGIARPAGFQFNPMPRVPFLSVPEHIKPTTYEMTIDVDETSLPLLRSRIEKLPGTAVFDVDEINKTIVSVVRQLAVLPFVIGAICLIVAVVVSGNSVALSTMERRGDIAILKTLGMQRERVLAMLIGESILLGLVSGVIGVMLSWVLLRLTMMLTYAMNGAEGMFSVSFPALGIAALFLMCPAIAGLAALVTAWPASAQKPLHLIREN